MYKFSRYNLLFSGCFYNMTILYNSLTKYKHVLVKATAKAVRQNRVELLPVNEMEIFKNQGFLVEESVNELELAEAKYHQRKNQNSNSLITLLPSTKCNLQCPYCYEEAFIHDKKTMQPQVMANVVRYIINEHLEKNDKAVLVKFYGGEPLIAPDVCTGMAEQLAEYARDHEKKIHFWLQTNGTLLTQEILDRIPNLDSIELTLEGEQARHDKIRTKSYHKILSVLELVMKNKRFIKLRINMSTLSSFNKVLDDLERIQLNRYPYFKFYTGIANNNFMEHVCFGSNRTRIKQVSEKVIMHEQLILRRGWNENYLKHSFLGGKSNICNYETGQNIIIDPEGKLYSCIFQIGNEDFCVGTIGEDGGVEKTARYNQLRERNPFRNSACVDCIFLPDCWSGCFAKSHFRHGDLQSGYCENKEGIYNTAKTGLNYELKRRKLKI